MIIIKDADVELFEKYHEACKSMWEALAITGDDIEVKEELFKDELLALGLTEKSVCDCFACEATLIGIEIPGNVIITPICNKCPIDWLDRDEMLFYSTMKFYCERGSSIYQKWRDRNTREERMKLAKEIAELPWTKK